jgi:hypothetical protein
VTGSVRICRQLDSVSVIVWGDDFPSWLLVLGELRLRASVVVVSSELHLSLIQSLVEEDCLVITAAHALSVLTPDTTGGCSLCLVDGRVLPTTARLLQSCGVTRILGTRGIRRAIPQWTNVGWSAAHWKLGGVTNEEVSGVCLALGSAPPASHHSLDSIGRDASTVLSIKAPGRKYRPSPRSSTVSPLGCEQLGTPLYPVYHGGGLLPGGCDKRTVVLSPGLYAPQGSWLQRTLTMEEVLIAKDCGRVAIDLLGAGLLPNSFLRNLVPGKCLVAFANRWGCNGGVTLFSPCQGRWILKRRRLNDQNKSLLPY